jgi:hypothetical protein
VASRFGGPDHRERPWCARRYRGKTYYFLGSYYTREQAEAAEAEFDRAHPPAPRGRRECHDRGLYQSPLVREQEAS